jgi:hypothetical protein
MEQGMPSLLHYAVPAWRRWTLVSLRAFGNQSGVAIGPRTYRPSLRRPTWSVRWHRYGFLNASTTGKRYLI